ncbi:MAG: DUF885 family protein [Bacillota bacterium]|jgi:hypothetical protein
MSSDTWDQGDLREFSRLDTEIARMVKGYEGGGVFSDTVFVPTAGNLRDLESEIELKMGQVKQLKDDFWRSHLSSVLESFLFKVKCDTMLPYAFLSRNSSILGSVVRAESTALDEKLTIIRRRLSSVPAMVRAIKDLISSCPEVGRSQVATTIPSFVGELKAAEQFVREHGASEGTKKEVSTWLGDSLAAVSELAGVVREVPVSELEPVRIPFEESVLKGMQAPLDYILEWVEDDVEYRRKVFFDTAREIDPNRDAYDLMNHGSVKYADAQSLLRGMESLLAHMQSSARQYVDLPEGESCEVIATPDAYKMVCPTAMYMDASDGGKVGKGFVCLNTDNLSAFSRASLEETTAHEVYPGHHTHFAVSATRNLPHTFKLSLPLSRLIIEGLAHRSEYLMIPHYVDPVSRLESARRGWYCSTRVKTEVDLYHARRPVKEMLQNYIENLNCTSYSATGQMQAHLAYPADAISYYTGMRILEDIYRESGLTQREFTNESFRYGNVAMATLRNIFSLPRPKRESLGNFVSGSLTRG